ncbi:hypothetical protein [Burkholderia pseudomallei]|uniref:hypothetical protein n=1 Tax=Burkholderia pseudomallei TaxID=28450 RepID=UPI0015600FF4|nr:hypothetical protein [Burkholderia pseudomallei]NRE46698.1 hypothetical protein [Burkholderia pseudomallei]
MKNIRDVRDELAGVFADLKSGKLKPADAAELNNAAGKIISSLKVELEYYGQRKEKPNIPFLGSGPNASDE